MDYYDDYASQKGTMSSLHEIISSWFTVIVQNLHLILARIVIAFIFWEAGLEMSDTLFASPDTIFIFENEYDLPYIAPYILAHTATIANHILPILLILGWGTRLAASFMLGMTLVIHFYVYPEEIIMHGLWVACLLSLLVKGAGILSLDHVIKHERSRSRRFYWEEETHDADLREFSDQHSI